LSYWLHHGGLYST